MASQTTGLTLWVKSEPFTFGALPVPPHPRLSVHVCTLKWLLHEISRASTVYWLPFLPHVKLKCELFNQEYRISISMDLIVLIRLNYSHFQ